jgi:Uncharacterized protein involved in copper resistance
MSRAANTLALCIALALAPSTVLAQESHAHHAHAGHAEAESPTQAPPANGPHAGPDAHADHATHDMQHSHAGHAAENAHDQHAASSAHDGHAGHEPHDAHAARNSHAGHAGHANHDMHAPAGTAATDPHAGHAMAPGAPIEPIPVPTDADRAAAFPPLAHAHAHGGGIHSLVRFNRFEASDADPGRGQAWEGKAWIGGDVHRLWLRSEGEREHGHTASADLEVLYGRGISAWWDLLAGVRHDFKPGPSQSWAAIGVQGMAPYKFEVSATAYLGEHGHSALRAEVEYELPLTSRLVLQPLVEVELHGRNDARRGTGSGLSTAEAGLRLRYELDRRFAPYIGLVHERSFGNTADYRRSEGEPVSDTRWVVGVRWWF